MPAPALPTPAALEAAPPAFAGPGALAGFETTPSRSAGGADFASGASSSILKPVTGFGGGGGANRPTSPRSDSLFFILPPAASDVDAEGVLASSFGFAAAFARDRYELASAPPRASSAIVDGGAALSAAAAFAATSLSAPYDSLGAGAACGAGSGGRVAGAAACRASRWNSGLPL